MPDDNRYSGQRGAGMEDGYTAPRRRYRSDSTIPGQGSDPRNYGYGNNGESAGGVPGGIPDESPYARIPQRGSGYGQYQQDLDPSLDSRYDEYDNYPQRQANHVRESGRARQYREQGGGQYREQGGQYREQYPQGYGTRRQGQPYQAQRRSGYNTGYNPYDDSTGGAYDGFDDNIPQGGGYQDRQQYNRRDSSLSRNPSGRDEYGRRGAYAAAARNDGRAYDPQRRSGGISGLFSNMWEGLGKDDDDRKMKLLIIGCVTLVIIGVILCICLQTCSSCGSHCAGSDIPVVEQGDGEEEEYIETDTEIVSIADGAVTIDQQAGAVDDFTVTVTGADGAYYRTNVKKDEAGTLTISEQNETGFFFVLNVGGGEISGYAYFNGETTAAYELAEGLIGFTFEDGTIKVYHTMQISDFGSVSADGVYTRNTPVFVEDTSAASEYDVDIRNTDAVKSALKGVMSSSDYELMNTIFSSGTCPMYQNDELTVDKNGKEVMVDSEMKAVKYYAFVNGAGEELVLICSGSGKVYIGICDGSEFRYYTNDEQYKSRAPLTISDQAIGRGMALKYC